MQDGNAFTCVLVNGSHLAIAEFRCLAHNMESHLFDSNVAGHTALHWASYEGPLSMMEYLVRSCGFDVKATDKVSTCLCG